LGITLGSIGAALAKGVTTRMTLGG
jgi:hypothetical protein